MDGGHQKAEIRSNEAISVGPSNTFYIRYGKRAFDVTLALVLLPILLPVMLLIALGMAHRGQVLFAQKRIGRGGKSFWIYKFRTMRVDAEAYLVKLCASDPAIAQEWAMNQCLDPDPRVTKLGKLLRRTKLDELPQLWNVLRGDMSFVGPRPFLPSQQPIYDARDGAKIYYEIRPGVTGPWQIDQERDKRFVVRAQYDYEYVRKITFMTDCALLLRTTLMSLKLSSR